MLPVAWFVTQICLFTNASALPQTTKDNQARKVGPEQERVYNHRKRSPVTPGVLRETLSFGQFHRSDNRSLY